MPRMRTFLAIDLGEKIRDRLVALQEYLAIESPDVKWVEPDNLEALSKGLQRWLDETPVPKWKEYCKENSWERNGEIVIQQMS